VSWRTWGVYLWGFVAGATLATYVAVSCAPTQAQSEEVAGAIHQAAVTYGVSEGWMRRIAYCESRYTPWVTSRGGHMGLFQYAPQTWRTFSRWAGYEGTSPYDPWSAAMVTAYALSRGYAGHWACR
jgi:hypothetical protein